MYTDLSYLNSAPLGTFLLIQHKYKARSSLSDARFTTFQPKHSRRQLNITMLKRIQFQTLQVIITQLFIRFFYHAKTTQLEMIRGGSWMKSGFSLTMVRDLILFKESIWVNWMNFPLLNNKIYFMKEDSMKLWNLNL